MDNLLIELSQLVKPKLTGKENELFKYIRSEQILPNKEKWNQSSSGFSHLKKRLTDKLIKELYVTNFEINTVADSHIDCYRGYGALQILRGLGKENITIELAEKILNNSRDLHFTELVYNTAFFLQNRYAIQGKRKKYKEITTILNSTAKVLENERICRQAYTSLILNFSESRALNETLINKAATTEKIISDNLSSHYTYLLYFSVQIKKHQLRSDPLAIIETCKKGVKHFQNKQYYYPSKFLFWFKMAYSYICLSNYEEANKATESALNTAPKESHNYNAALVYKAIIGFWSKQDHLIDSSIKESDSPYIFENSIEQWKIIKGFGELYKRLENKDSNNYRIQKYLNEIKVYEKDKSGNNINLLILQCVHLLLNKNYDRFGDKVDTLRVYSIRYLTGESLDRVRFFFRLLAKVPKGYFNRIVTERKTKKLFAQLQTIPVKNPEIEIIPFEYLWTQIVLSLDN